MHGQDVEEDCFSSSASAAVYRSKLANAATRCKALAGVDDLARLAPQAAAALVEVSHRKEEAALPCTAAASAGRRHTGAPGTAQGGSSSSTEQDLRRAFNEVERLLGQPDLQPVLDKLAGMGDAQVTAAMLQKEGFGHRLKALSKSAHAVVASAAKQVIRTWKDRVCKELQ